MRLARWGRVNCSRHDGPDPCHIAAGAVTVRQLSDALGKPVEIDPAILVRPDIAKDGGLLETGSDYKPKAPGMKYKHYAPKAEMIIFRGDPQKVRLAMAEEKMYRMECGQKVGIIMYGDDQKEAAHDFFAQLRAFAQERRRCHTGSGRQRGRHRFCADKQDVQIGRI